MTAAKEAYDQMSEHYDDSYKLPVDKAEDLFVESLIRKAGEHLSGPVEILDLGCGTGLGYRLAQMVLFPSVMTYVGADPSKKMAAKARQTVRDYNPGERTETMICEMNADEAVVGTRPDTPDEEGFNLVLSLYSAGYYKDLHRVLRNIAKNKIKKGGVLILATTALERITSGRYGLAAKNMDMGVPISVYTPQGLADMVDRTKWEIIEQGGYSGPIARKFSWLMDFESRKLAWLLGSKFDHSYIVLRRK